SPAVTFLDPTASFTVNAGSGNDSITQSASLGSLAQPFGDLLYQAETITLSGTLYSSGTSTYDTGLNGINVSEISGAAITADKLLILGRGTFRLERDNVNDVVTLAANIDGTLAYSDTNALSIGTVGTTSGITSTSHDVK